jgi:hypothetical protein
VGQPRKHEYRWVAGDVSIGARTIPLNRLARMLAARFSLEHGDRPTPLDGVLGMACYVRSLSLINAVGTPPRRPGCPDVPRRLDNALMVLKGIMNGLVHTDSYKETWISGNTGASPSTRPSCIHDGLRHGCLRQLYIQRDHTARLYQRVRHRLNCCESVGLLRYGLLGQRDAHLVRQGREAVHPRRPLLACAPECFAIQRHRRVRRLKK